MGDAFTHGYKEINNGPPTGYPYTEYHCYECWNGNGHCVVYQPTFCADPNEYPVDFRCPIFTNHHFLWHKIKTVDPTSDRIEARNDERTNDM